ncbi:MAG: methyltransferase domain-containing protein [Elusimicrobiota bacterium]
MNIFDRYYKEYDNWYERNEEVFQTEINTIKRFDLKGRGLEVGTGTGRFAEALGIKHGIEPSLNMLMLARQRGVNAVHGKAETNPYKDNSFDFALMMATFCFLEDPVAVLIELRRILKDNALLIIAIVAKDSEWGKYYQRKNSPFYNEARFYSTEEVMGLLEDTGYSAGETYQSLFAGPENFDQIEEPLPGYDKGSFVAIGAKK